MLQRDPLRQNVYKHIWLVVLYTLFVACLLYILLSQLLSIYSSTDTPSYMLITYIVLFLLLLLSLALTWGWFWSMCGVSRRRRQKRLRALQGDQELLFSTQPSRNEHALALPVTIEVKMRMTSFFLLSTGLVILYLSLLALALSLQYVSFAALRFLMLTNGGMLLSSLLFVWLVARIAARYAHQKITVTEQGITIRYRGKTRSLAWNEARFFSLHGSARFGRTPLLYELASMKRSVVWVQLRARSFWLRPLIPFEAYQQQMNALSALVAARTGLPLYDLRDHAV